MKRIIRKYKSEWMKTGSANLIVLLLIIIFSTSCNENVKDAGNRNKIPKIFPEYYNHTLPANIAPLNFIIKEPGSKFNIEITGQSDGSIIIQQSSPKIKIPIKKWRRLLAENSDKNISIKIWAKEKGEWIKYQDISHHVSKDTIDPYLVYRLVHATYLKWHKMGIYQRNLTNFNETPIIENNSTDNGCMNCHTFSGNNPNTMAIHFRIIHPGTLIWKNGELTFTNTKSENNMSAGIYPAWHPNGKHIAFSTGKISPHLTTRINKPVDVADKASGLFVYNTETTTVLTTPELATERRESMPEWSVDGKFLYFISAPEAEKGDDESLLHQRYSLMRIPFDTESETWGKAEMVLNAESIGKSISMPVASPNGKYMVCSMSDYGYFTIFHQNSDLHIINLETKEYKKMELNSEFAESHSQWSTNSKWLVFSSKRTDGVLTRPYISYIDDNGNSSNPFLLPQEDPEINDLLQANYNRPELVSGKVNLKPIEIRNIVNSVPEKIGDKLE